MLPRYIRAQVILGGLSLIYCSTAMLELGFPNAIALGVMAGILEFIPIAGWMIAGVTIVSAGALAHAHWTWMLVLLCAWRILMDYLISPRVMELEIHPLLAIFAMMVGGAPGGIVGIYLSMPLVATLRVICSRLRHVELRWSEGTEPFEARLQRGRLNLRQTHGPPSARLPLPKAAV
jgi:predicted PurR-regulated permease PerM